MSEYIVLHEIELRPQHPPTGRTRHFQGEDQLPPPSILQIVKYGDEDGYYLLYLDEDGKEQTDTYHDSLAAAMAQAEGEFQVRPSEWRPCASNEASG